MDLITEASRRKPSSTVSACSTWTGPAILARGANPTSRVRSIAACIHYPALRANFTRAVSGACSSTPMSMLDFLIRTTTGEEEATGPSMLMLLLEEPMRRLLIGPVPARIGLLDLFGIFGCNVAVHLIALPARAGDAQIGADL